MKTKSILILVLGVISSYSFAQTKLIAHKSHSGKGKNFTLALKSNKFRLKHSNFGLHEYLITEVKKAEIIKGKTIIVTLKEYWNTNIDKQTIRKDTLHNSPLLKKGYSASELKNALQKHYKALGRSKNMELLNYPVRQRIQPKKATPKKSKKIELNQPKKSAPKVIKEKTSQTVDKSQAVGAIKTQSMSSYDPFLLGMVGLVAGISLLIGGIAWRLRKLGLLQT